MADEAMQNNVGNTSVTVKVKVEADRGGNVIPVLSSTMVFVAVDNNNKPVSSRDFACGREHSEDNREHSGKQRQTKKNKENKNKRCEKHKSE